MGTETNTPITEDDLIRLMKAKDAAQIAWEAAYRAAEMGKTEPAAVRVKLDTAKVVARRASAIADIAYDNALRAFGDAQPMETA